MLPLKYNVNSHHLSFQLFGKEMFGRKLLSGTVQENKPRPVAALNYRPKFAAKYEFSEWKTGWGCAAVSLVFL